MEEDEETTAELDNCQTWQSRVEFEWIKDECTGRTTLEQQQQQQLPNGVSIWVVGGTEEEEEEWDNIVARPNQCVFANVIILLLIQWLRKFISLLKYLNLYSSFVFHIESRLSIASLLLLVLCVLKAKINSVSSFDRYFSWQPQWCCWQIIISLILV